MRDRGRSRGATGRQGLLTRRWLHAHEEDTATETVFRPATYKFPPSRGRWGFELNADGTMLDIGLGPADRPQEKAGTWKLEDIDRLLFFGGAEPSRSLRIVSVDRERLLILKASSTARL